MSMTEERFTRLLQLQQQSNQLLQELISDPIIQEYREQHPEVTDELLRDHALKTREYRNDRRCCVQCPGLPACPLPFPGHYTNLEVVKSPGTGVLQLADRRVRCRIQKQQDKQQQLRSRITAYNVDLEHSYDITEIAIRDRDRTPAIRGILDYIKRVQDAGALPKEGLYINGHFGTGKTYLMGFLLHQMADLGYAGAIVYMPEFVEDMKYQMQDAKRLQETVQQLKQADLLILDDIGAENLNPWFRDHILGAILNDRMDKKPTFYTSNYALEDLLSHLSFTHKEGEDRHKAERLMNRIQPYVKQLQLGGGNQRYDGQN